MDTVSEQPLREETGRVTHPPAPSNLVFHWSDFFLWDTRPSHCESCHLRGAIEKPARKWPQQQEPGTLPNTDLLPGISQARPGEPTTCQSAHKVLKLFRVSAVTRKPLKDSAKAASEDCCDLRH